MLNFRPWKLRTGRFAMQIQLSERWLNHFMRICMLVSEMSKDPSTKVGSVIVRPDRTLCSTGYNGFPKPCQDHPSTYGNRSIKLQRIIHAEMNAILHVRERLDGYAIFTWPLPPCDRCMPHIIQSGIGTIVSPSIDSSQPWFDSAMAATAMAEEAGIRIIRWNIK